MIVIQWNCSWCRKIQSRRFLFWGRGRFVSFPSQRHCSGLYERSFLSFSVVFTCSFPGLPAMNALPGFVWLHRTVGICVYAKVFVTVSGLCSIRIKSLRSIYLLSFAVHKGYCESLSLIPQCQGSSPAQITGLCFPCRKTTIGHHFEIIYFRNSVCPLLRMFSLVAKSDILKCS